MCNGCMDQENLLSERVERYISLEYTYYQMYYYISLALMRTHHNTQCYNLILIPLLTVLEINFPCNSLKIYHIKLCFK
jgi:hypothetical protein